MNPKIIVAYSFQTPIALILFTHPLLSSTFQLQHVEYIPRDYTPNISLVVLVLQNANFPYECHLVVEPK